MTIERKLTELRIEDAITSDEIVDNMLGYFRRSTDHAAINSKLVTMFGLGVKTSKDPDSDAVIETYVKGDFKEKVDNGMVEALSIGFASKVSNALATLTTEPGHKFSLKHDTSEDTDDAQELLNYHRERGNYSAAIVETDVASVQVGSFALFINWTSGSLNYQSVSPSRITAFFDDYVTENDDRRPVDKRNIEDASVVVIELDKTSSGDGKSHFLAIFGRSDIYPKGRYVSYFGQSKYDKIPEPGPEVDDWTTDGGEIANPLTVIQDLNDDDDLPEYPIAIIYGGTTENETLFPTTSSLYEDSLEFDVAASRLLRIVTDEAKGTNVLSIENEGINKPLPRSLVGDVALQPGHKFDRFSGNPSGVFDAIKSVRALMVELAAGYSVPDYMVSSEDHALEASSGIALEVKSRALIKNRQKRVALNSASINRIFLIEKGLIQLHETEAGESEIRLLSECVQVWDAGYIRLPENKKEAVERIKMLGEMGLLDTIAQIREYNQFASDEEAIEEYEKMKSRKEEFPPLKETEALSPVADNFEIDV